MTPAEQSLHADQRAGLQTQLRLVMQQQLPLLDDLAQVEEQFATLGIFRVQLPVEAGSTIAAIALGNSGRACRTGQQFAGLLAVGRETGEAERRASPRAFARR
jgi:hypothetical protein